MTASSESGASGAALLSGILGARDVAQATRAALKSWAAVASAEDGA